MEHRQKIVVSGAGIAGSLIVSGLKGRRDIELICLERVTESGHADAGTGLNIGPNAMKALGAIMPEQAETIIANSYPWARWQIGLTDGRSLMDLDLSEVADNPGIRIRWAELYALLRGPLGDRISYGKELTGCDVAEGKLFVTCADAGSGATQTHTDIDLLIAGDGRYSKIRSRFFGDEVPQMLGVCLYRVLFPAGDNCPIEDYGQWFNGSNRLLAFRVPGNFVYCAGSFPIEADGVISDSMKSAEALRRYYTPAHGAASPQAAHLIDSITTYWDRIHWARLQDGTVQYAGAPGVLLVGDAAHPMVPTLGQGATQAVEDACVVVEEIIRALDEGRGLAGVPERVSARRTERAQFVVDFSRDATDTMMAGADPVRGTLKKLEPAFRDRLKRLYRNVGADA